MSRRLVMIALAAVAAGVLAAESGQGRRASALATSAETAPTFVFTGRGWGHGVGMSQYGAFGFARRGWAFGRILAHYYPGTELTRTAPQQVRVLLVEGRSSVTIASESPFRVRDGLGTIHRLAAGEYALGPLLKLKLGDRAAEPLPGPLTFMPGSRPLQLRKPYRGWIQVSSDGRKVQAINLVGLEPYLYGVVPDEVPDTWPPEALKAQAVAARSYALATRKTGGAFDLYADTRSQVYGGLNAESFATTAAVDATSGQALTYRGRPAITYFFSTSGGRTAAIQDAWPGARPVPYLVSVPDPYDSLSPHHRWGPLAFSPKPLLRKLRISGKLRDVRTVVNPSGRVGSVVAVTELGEIAVRGTDVRRALGLRSTWFRVGVLALTGPPTPIAYGSAAKLSGVARGVSGVSLQQRVAGKIWEPAAPISAKNGTFATTVKPQATTEYRLASGKIASGSLRVGVAPVVRFALAEEPGVLRGSVRPVLPGAFVQIQRLADTVWRIVKTVQVDERGSFEAQLELTPGSYRARVAPGGGFVPGVSTVLKVVVT